MTGCSRVLPLRLCMPCAGTRHVARVSQGWRMVCSPISKEPMRSRAIVSDACCSARLALLEFDEFANSRTGKREISSVRACIFFTRSQ